jgi:hypothetical protein
MKKTFFFFVILTALTAWAPVQILSAEPADSEKGMGFSLWTGPEWNMNSRYLFSLGGVLGVDYAVNTFYSLGIKGIFSYNFNKIFVLEGEVFFRRYFLYPSGLTVFLQGDMGASFIFADSLVYTKILGGISGGIRIWRENFFLEPHGRLGYPFVFGLGVTGGYSF